MEQFEEKAEQAEKEASEAKQELREAQMRVDELEGAKFTLSEQMIDLQSKKQSNS